MVAKLGIDDISSDKEEFEKSDDDTDTGFANEDDILLLMICISLINL